MKEFKGLVANNKAEEKILEIASLAEKMCDTLREQKEKSNTEEQEK